MIKIRLFENSDAPQLIEVARKAWYYTYKEIFSKKEIESFIEQNYNKDTILEGNSVQNSFWVAEKDGKIIGYIQIGMRGGEMRLWRIYVDPDHIGKGIGSMLLEAAEKFMIEKGIRRYALKVHPKNELGISFYRRKGFNDAKNKDDKNDEMIMEKYL